MFLFDRSHFSIKVNTEKWVFAMTIIWDPLQVPFKISVIILQFWRIVHVVYNFLVVRPYQDPAKLTEVFLDIAFFPQFINFKRSWAP